MAVINPYLIFDGQAEQAFNFYKSVFGGEFATLMRMGDIPDEPYVLTDAEKNFITHVSLPIGQHNFLMGSDIIKSAGHQVSIGSNIQISLNVESEEEARHLFNGLSVNGEIEMPLENTFWGALFGSFTDQFGIKWMINYQHTEI
jgi:PhnB protein